MTQTGPRTRRAKRRVSANAVRHGLRSMKVVIPGLEFQADWDIFFKDSIAALKPVGAIEYALVERIAGLLWRLRRVPHAEPDAAIAGKLPDPRERDFHDAAVRVLTSVHAELGITGWGGPVARDSVPEPKPAVPQALPVLSVPLELQTFSKNEYRLSRQLLHTMHELWFLQDRRQGNATPLLLDEAPNDA